MKLRKTFEEGRQAYINGVAMECCPYDESNPLKLKWWFKGYEFQMNFDLFEDSTDEN